MGEPSWKELERRTARSVGGEKAALSGIRGGVTHGDMIHEALYGEFKHLARSAAITLFWDTRRKGRAEARIPVVGIHQRKTQKVIAILEWRDFAALYNLLAEHMGGPEAVLRAVTERRDHGATERE